MSIKQPSSVDSEPRRKEKVLHSAASHDEIQNTLRRGSLDISISPVISLKKGALNHRRESELFDSMSVTGTTLSINFYLEGRY